MSSIIDLDCSICYERFDDPRILNCGHTFCLGCLSRIHTPNYIKQIRCPECNTKTSVRTGFNNLIVNWTVRKAIDSEKESRAAPTSQIPPCKLHDSQSILYCQQCVELICSKCLGNHSDHLGEIGPVGDATSPNGKFIRSVVDKLTSRKQELKVGAGFWDYYSDRLRSCEKAQTAEIECLDMVISKLKEKHQLLKSEIKSSYEKQFLEIREFSAALATAQSNLDIALQKMNSLPTSSDASSFDWSLVSKSEDLLTSHPAPTNFPDLSATMVDTVKRGVIDEMHRLALSLEIQKDRLPEHPKIVRDFQVLFAQVSSVSNYLESSLVVFDQIKVSVLMFPRGTEGESTGKLGLFLKFQVPEGVHFDIHYELSLINQIRATESVKAATRSTIVRDTRVGWGDFCSSDQILKLPNDFCIKDTIQIRAVLEVQ